MKFLWSVNEILNGAIFAESESKAREILNKEYNYYDLVEAEGHKLCKCGKIFKDGIAHDCR